MSKQATGSNIIPQRNILEKTLCLLGKNCFTVVCLFFIHYWTNQFQHMLFGVVWQKGIHLKTCITCTICPFTHLKAKSYYFETTNSCSCPGVWQRPPVNINMLFKARGEIKRPKNDFLNLGSLSISSLANRIKEMPFKKKELWKRKKQGSDIL